VRVDKPNMLLRNEEPDSPSNYLRGVMEGDRVRSGYCVNGPCVNGKILCPLLTCAIMYVRSA
jgi:hypothetical protein